MTLVIGVDLALAWRDTSALYVLGGVLLGVLPGQPGISWQAHLFGAIGGGIAAMALAERRPSQRQLEYYG